MTGFFILDEMINREVGFDRDQSTLPKHNRRLPRRDKACGLIEERLLNKSRSVELNLLIEIGHPSGVVGGIQRDLICLNDTH